MLGLSSIGSAFAEGKEKLELLAKIIERAQLRLICALATRQADVCGL